MPREQSVLDNQEQAVGEDADEADHEQPGPGAQNIEGLLGLDHEVPQPAGGAEYVCDHHRGDPDPDPDSHAGGDLGQGRREDDHPDALAPDSP